MHRFARSAVVSLALAASHAGGADAHSAAARSCGAIRDDGDPVGIVVQHGKAPCSTARRILRTYLRSHALCSGSSCLRRRSGWTCQTAPAFQWPRLPSCSRAKREIAAYAPAD